MELKKYESLDKMLREIFIDISNIEMNEGGIEGIGGGGASSSVKASVIFKNPELNSQIDLFIKFMRKGSMAENYNAQFWTFDKEILFYQVILPEMERFIKSTHNESCDIMEMLPKFYGAGRIDSDVCLILKDFMKKDFFVVKQEDFFTLDQILNSVTFIAKFHSVSYAMQKLDKFDKIGVDLEKYLQDQLGFEGNEKLLNEYFFHQAEKNMEFLLAIVDEKSKNNPLTKEFKIPSIVNKEKLTEFRNVCCHLLKAMRYCRLPTGTDVDVLCHGDFHMWNVAFQNPDSKNVKVFDLQAFHKGPYACDLHHFLSQTCTPEFRTKHIEEILGKYVTVFQNSCQNFGLETDLTFEKVFEEYKIRSPIGFIFGANFILRRFVKNWEAFEKAKKATKTDEIVEFLNQSHPAIFETLKIYFDIVKEHIELGTLETIGKFVNKE